MSETSVYAANAIIGIIGVFFFIQIVFNAIRLLRLKNKLNDCYKVNKVEKKKATKKGIITQKIEEENLEFEQVDDIRIDYSKICAKANIFIQLISIFPMLGLLGTVVGIQDFVKDINKASDALQKMDSLSFALTTTITGLLCALILKVIATATVMKQMGLIDDLLYEADRQFNHLVDQGIIDKAIEDNYDEKEQE